ncbi:MAG: TRAP transporter substrate-binding protein [Pseudomonadota bacterium]
MNVKGVVFGSLVGLVAIFGSPAVQGQTVQLVYANGYAKTHVQVGVVADEWIKRIEEQTQGRVKIRHVPGGALLKPENMLEGLRGRVADIGSLVVSFFPGQLPISATLASTIDPNLGNKLDLKGVTAITMRLIEEFDAVGAEYDKLGVKAVYWVPTPAYAIIANKSIQGLGDFKGKKMRAFGTNLPKLLDAAGAAPLAMAFGEIYTSLQTGVIDGAVTDPPAMISGKFGEVAKNVITTGPGDGAISAIAPVAYLFNNESWAKLTKQDQDIVRKVSREMTPYGADKMIEAQNGAFDELRKQGVTVRHLSVAETEELTRKSPDFYKLAADSINEKGLPGTAIVDRYKALAMDYLAGKWKPF